MSFKKDGSWVRLQRKNQIKKQIVQHFPSPVDYKQTVRWILANIGLTRKKAVEYLNEIVECEGWILNDGVILAE